MQTNLLMRILKTVNKYGCSSNQQHRVVRLVCNEIDRHLLLILRLGFNNCSREYCVRSSSVLLLGGGHKQTHTKWLVATIPTHKHTGRVESLLVSVVVHSEMGLFLVLRSRSFPRERAQPTLLALALLLHNTMQNKLNLCSAFSRSLAAGSRRSPTTTAVALALATSRRPPPLVPFLAPLLSAQFAAVRCCCCRRRWLDALRVVRSLEPAAPAGGRSKRRSLLPPLKPTFRLRCRFCSHRCFSARARIHSARPLRSEPLQVRISAGSSVRLLLRHTS